MELETYIDYCLLHSESKEYKKKVEKSKVIINNFLDLSVKCYGAISGGKDSTVMMHLINSNSNTTPFVSEKDDMDFPNELSYINELRDKYNLNLTILTPNVKLWDIIKDYNFIEDIHSQDCEFSKKYFYDLLKNHQKEFNYKGVFLGLRNEESKGRLWNFKSKGNIYYNNEWNQLICQPLSEWKGIDIFAYLFSNEIPILDVYLKTKFVKSPEEIRKSWILPSSQTNSGQALWLKYYYPEIFTKLSIINPKLRNYV